MSDSVQSGGDARNVVAKDASVDYGQRLVQLLPVIERIHGAIAARYRLDPDEREDFESYAQLKLIEDDYRRLRAFGGRSKMSTYLRTVLTNLFRDYRIEKWGKYRVSKAAQRLGPAAILLDRMIRRDRRSESTAIQTVLARSDIEEDEAALEAMVRALPERQERRVDTEPEEFFVRTPSAESAETRQESHERRARLQPVLAALAVALEEMDSQDRLILKLRFFEGLRFVDIAKRLELEQKPLYRRVETVLKHLRGRMLEEDVNVADVQELLGESLGEVDFQITAAKPPKHEDSGDSDTGANSRRPSNDQ